jgi:hypothetical protein
MQPGACCYIQLTHSHAPCRTLKPWPPFSQPTASVQVSGAASKLESGADGNLEFLVSVTAGGSAPSYATTIYFSLGGTAAVGSQYAITTPLPQGFLFSGSNGSFVIPPSQGSAVLALQPVDDTKVDGDMTVVLELLSSAVYDIDGNGASAEATIVDDDVPQLTIAAGPPVFEDSTAQITFTFTLSQVMVGLVRGARGSHGAGWVLAHLHTAWLCELGLRELCIMSGGWARTSTACILVRLVLDLLPFIHSHSPLYSYDRTDPPLPRFACLSLPDVALSYLPLQPAPWDITVHFSVGGTATYGSDYTVKSGAASFTSGLITQGSVKVPAGASNASLVLQPLVDSADEGDETIIITAWDSNYYYAPMGTAATGTIYGTQVRPRRRRSPPARGHAHAVCANRRVALGAACVGSGARSQGYGRCHDRLLRRPLAATDRLQLAETCLTWRLASQPLAPALLLITPGRSCSPGRQRGGHGQPDR